MAHNVSWEGQDTTAHDPMHCHVLQVRVEASCQASTAPWGVVPLSFCSLILIGLKITKMHGIVELNNKRVS